MSMDELNIWLVVGLGNPGRRYEGTYHNMGRIAAVEFARAREGFDGRWVEKFKGEFCRVDVGDARVFVLLLETYMNLSGEAVTKAAGMYNIQVRNIIMHDDLDLEPGAPSGSRPATERAGTGGLNRVFWPWSRPIFWLNRG